MSFNDRDDRDDVRDRSYRADSKDRDGDNVRPRLVHLKDASDLQVADGDPDIRGWELRTTEGLEIGKVEDLVVDTSLMRVRYIEGELKLDDRRSGEHHRVLIPIESARLDDDDDLVVVDYSTVTSRTFPEYDGATMPVSDIGDDELFDDRNFFGARRHGRESTPYIAPVDGDVGHLQRRGSDPV